MRFVTFVDPDDTPRTPPTPTGSGPTGALVDLLRDVRGRGRDARGAVTIELDGTGRPTAVEVSSSAMDGNRGTMERAIREALDAAWTDLDANRQEHAPALAAAARAQTTDLTAQARAFAEAANAQLERAVAGGLDRGGAGGGFGVSAGFEITYDLLRRSATEIDAARGELTAATDKLGTTVGGADDPWGSDEQGSAFAAVYRETLTHVLSAMRTHAGQLDYAAQSLRFSADAHQDNDQAVTELFTTLGESTQGGTA